MAKNKPFSKAVAEIIKDTTAKTKDGKMKKTFSRKFWNDVANAMMNDPDYEFPGVTMKDGEAVETKTKPVQAFREKIIQPIAQEAGMDQTDAKKFAEEYQFNKAQSATVYDLSMAIDIENMRCGKALRVPRQKEWVATISVRDMPESTYENPPTGVKTKKKACKQLVKRSTTPAWLKQKI